MVYGLGLSVGCLGCRIEVLSLKRRALGVP